MITEISTDHLIDAAQIGWIEYLEGDMYVKVKVIRTRKGEEPFLSHVTGFRHGVGQVDVVRYKDVLTWNQKAKHMLKEFRDTVGERHFFYFENPIARQKK